MAQPNIMIIIIIYKALYDGNAKFLIIIYGYIRICLCVWTFSPHPFTNTLQTYIPKRKQTNAINISSYKFMMACMNDSIIIKFCETFLPSTNTHTHTHFHTHVAMQWILNKICRNFWGFYRVILGRNVPLCLLYLYQQTQRICVLHDDEIWTRMNIYKMSCISSIWYIYSWKKNCLNLCQILWCSIKHDPSVVGTCVCVFLFLVYSLFDSSGR